MCGCTIIDSRGESESMITRYWASTDASGGATGTPCLFSAWSKSAIADSLTNWFCRGTTLHQRLLPVRTQAMRCCR